MLRLASCHRGVGNPRAPSGVPGPSWRSEARISSRKALQLKDEIVASPVIFVYHNVIDRFGNMQATDSLGERLGH